MIPGGSPRPAAVVAQGINKRFQGLQALKDLDVEIPAGVVSALVGPNGAGKTTFFNVVSGFVRPDSGSVRLVIDGQTHEVTGFRPHRIARLGVARTFQQLRLVPDLSVVDNIRLAADPWRLGQQMTAALLRRRRPDREARVEQLLERTGLGRRANALVSDLSYAEQKLVSITRVLAFGGKLLLLDEPTSGLDPIAVDDMVQFLRRLPEEEGVTLCIVEHSVETVRRVAEHVIFMDQGTVVRGGPTEDIVTDKALIDIYFGA